MSIGSELAEDRRAGAFERNPDGVQDNASHSDRCSLPSWRSDATVAPVNIIVPSRKTNLKGELV
jgi:hypothetical protein